MDAVEEAMDHNSSSSSCNNTNSSDQFTLLAAIVKGKRTKRQRPVTVASAELSSSTTEEEEAMANCLILLAQGCASDTGPETEAMAKEATPTEKFHVYQCKTCDKCFPSFQALGGHRTSHKKPKIALTNDADAPQISMNSFISKPVLTSNDTATAGGISAVSNKPRVHKCSICGSEFSSGQALGGHMRRHRLVTAAELPESKERTVLSLDLNLPAPWPSITT